MIPLRLSLNGIYSYRTLQQIDFTKLTDNHLFGIFGSVGSGKSTILEAISYALYGETERLNTRDNRNYNMMNLKSDELYIDFEFKAGKGNKNHYRFTVEAKRDKKDFGNVKKYDRTAYKKEGIEWIPIDEDSAPSIIGLSYENFRRTIILPQGKFQEFLQLGESDRTVMLQEIFNLNKFDLIKKLDIIEKSTSERLNGVKGQLLEIGNVTPELAKQESLRLTSFEKEKINAQAALAKNEQDFNEQEELNKLFQKVKKQIVEIKRLENQKVDFAEREANLENYEKCLQLFPDLFEQHSELLNTIKVLKKKIDSDNKTFDDTSKDLQQNSFAYEGIRQRYENRSVLDQQCNELEKIKQHLDLEEDLKRIGKQIAVKELELKTVSDNILKHQTVIKESDNKIKTLKKDVPNIDLLYQILDWHHKQSDLESATKELKSRKKDQESELKVLVQEKKSLLSDKTLNKYLNKNDLKKQTDIIIACIGDVRKQLKKEIKDKEAEIKGHGSISTLELYSKELTDGKPCPLCGSEHHPNIFSSKGIAKVIRDLEKKKDLLKRDEELLSECSQGLLTIYGDEKNANKNMQKYLKDLDAKENLLNTHVKKFIWKGYPKDDKSIIEKEIKKAEEMKKELDGLEEKRDAINQKVEKLQITEKGISSDLLTLEKLKEKKQGGIQELSKSMRYYKASEWSILTIQNELRKLKTEIVEIDREYKRLTDVLKKLNDVVNTLTGSLKIDNSNYGKNNESLKKIESTISERLKQGKYPSREKVEQILKMKINPITEKKAITDYRQKLESAKEILLTLQKDQNNRAYNELKHESIRKKLVDSRNNLEGINKEIGRLEKSIKDINAKIDKKIKLDKEKDFLDKKSENITTLKRLFRGNKFVSFASRVYLENIVYMANQRFLQLTRQKLRLELDEKNSFLVRDYLNDGKTRIAKTLSGGQMFQASLSLALALSDSIQKLNNTEENFFFMDEGFGTLDKDTLNIVFESLKSLRKENRVVGVISHVEDMQQEIENCIWVNLTEENGSIISTN